MTLFFKEAFKEKIYRAEERHRCAERAEWAKQHRISKINSFVAALGVSFSAIAAAGGIAAAGYAASAYIEAKRQANYAEDSLLQTEKTTRPYLLFDLVSVDLDQGENYGTTQPLLPSYKHWSYTVKFRFKNYGATPGMLIQMKSNLERQTSPKNIGYFRTETNFKKSVLASGEFSENFEESRNVPFSMTPKGPSAKLGPGLPTFDDYFNQRMNIFFHGMVEYTDISNIPYHTEVCMRVMFPEKNLEQVTDENCRNERS